MSTAKKKSKTRTRAAPRAPRPPTRSRLVAPREGATAAEMVEAIVGCKWSLHVLAQVRAGVHRPGALARSAPGLTRKVLGERLDKMVRFGIFERRSFAQAPPKVEYHLTPLGARFVRLIDEVDRLQRELVSSALLPKNSA